MKKFFLLLISVCVLFKSCDKLPADELASVYNEIHILQTRIDLQSRVNLINGNISALKLIADAQNDSVFVTSLDAADALYSIRFTDGSEATIYNWKYKSYPDVSVSRDQSAGKYFWTLDGEWLLGADGEKISAEGKGGIKPCLKIGKDGWWYVSVDGSVSFRKLYEVPDTEDIPGHTFLKELSDKGDQYILILSDSSGTELKLVKYLALSVNFDCERDDDGLWTVPTVAGDVVNLAYSISTTEPYYTVAVASDGFYAASVQRHGDASGSLTVKSPDPFTEGAVEVLVHAGIGKTNISTISFYESRVDLRNDRFNVDASAEVIDLSFKANSDVVVTVPEGCNWIETILSKETRKAGEQRTVNLKLVISANPGYARDCNVSILPSSLSSKASATVRVRQKGSLGDEMLFSVHAAASNGYKAYIPLDKCDCTVDWGDGTSEKYLIDGNSLVSLPNHTYPSSDKVYTVSVSGIVTSLSSINSYTENLSALESVLQWGDTGLTEMDNAFRGFSKLSSVATDSNGAFADVKSMSKAFSGTALASLPSDLFKFASNVTDFSYLFDDCTSLTSLPSGLFDGLSKVSGIEGMFSGCKGLLYVPQYLFSSFSKVTSFNEVFYHCESLLSVPSDVFSYSPDASSFKKVFAFCKALSSVPSSVFDNNRSASVFESAFRSCFKLTCESPYTEIEGVGKVHLYERKNHPSHFVSPSSYEDCFSSTPVSDKAAASAAGWD